MNVVYRICADSAFHGVRDRLFWQKKIEAYEKNLFFLSTHTFRFRLMVFDLFMFIY